MALTDSVMFEAKAGDSNLVHSAMLGDRAAFGELYTQHKRMVHGILLAHLPYADAEDLMQTVFLQAMQRLPSLRDSSAFGGWLAAIARNAIIDHHRHHKNLVELQDRSEPRSGKVRSDEAEQALRAIRRLPPAYRETLMLRLVEGMTGPEIAMQTNLTPESVRVNLCRGMKLLRAELGSKEKHA